MKNTIIDLRYNIRQYIGWLLINFALILLSYFIVNLISPSEPDKTRLFFQLSGYLLFFWMAGVLYYSSLLFSRRGFILDITNLPLYVLVNVHIVSFLLQFAAAFTFLVIVMLTDRIELNMSLIGIAYFIALTYLLLIPSGILLSLLEYFSQHMRRNVIILLTVIMLSVSILWVPVQLPALVVKILSLNPFYFLVNGFQTAVVEGVSVFYKVPLHLLFLCELIFVYIWTFYLYRKLKDEITGK
ncbi:hypothetical protein [Macrococcus carouselicus]|uniref:hypothetical protein n=1 Tax=Macrococcus carouselicus TaxID=69969 RepID=UPI001407E4D1|nr:hypothetical protein [Macrococcus carouselicus]